MEVVDLARQARRAGVLVVLIAVGVLGEAEGRPGTDRAGEGVELDAASERTGERQAAAAAITIEVVNDVLGVTPAYLGGTEGAAFYISDLLDLGFNTYRLYTDMADLEPVDDDDYSDGVIDGDGYGTPTKTQIKNDASRGFRRRIPWAVWDERFNEADTWRYGVQTRSGTLTQLVENGITPIVLLRTYNAHNSPELRPLANWAPRPPVDGAFRNEWWEHCFAMAYWLNVRNSYGITRFEVLNEPEIVNPLDPTKGQGWANYGGTRSEYVKLVKDAYSAVKYANDMVGLPTYIHAPNIGSSAANGTWIPYVLDQADAEIQVVDFHKWDPNDAGAVVNGVRQKIKAHNTDGVVEPIWVTEWGTYDWLVMPYTTLARAILTAEQLMGYAEKEAQGLTIYNTYQWGIVTDPPQTALINLQDDGAGGVIRVRTETYYVYRLLIRALKGAKQRLDFSASGLPPGGRAMVTRDASALYVLLKNGNGTVDVNLSALPCYEGAVATVYEYSTARKDEVKATPLVASGHLAFSAPDSSVLLAQVSGAGC